MTGTAHTLWIDEITFVPLLWQVATTQKAAPSDEGLYFVYDESIDIRPPGGHSYTHPHGHTRMAFGAASRPARRDAGTTMPKPRTDTDEPLSAQ